MAKKLKEWYDLKYLNMLADKILAAYPKFAKDDFIISNKDKLVELEFGERQVLIANSLKELMPQDYDETIAIFHKILGEELPDNYGNFSEGYWLWPIGKYVELYGTENLETSLSFAKELTKSFTSEYCMRPLIAKYPDEVIPVLVNWSKDKNVRVRRLSSECLRINLPWSKKLYTALNYFDEYKRILTNLNSDPDIHIKKSVGNNLNDLYKHDSEKFYEIVSDWESEETTAETHWIIKHGSRNIEKD